MSQAIFHYHSFTGLWGVMRDLYSISLHTFSGYLGDMTGFEAVCCSGFTDSFLYMYFYSSDPIEMFR